MLGNRAHEDLQPPSNLEERKGLKEAQHAAHVRSAAHPHPPRTRGVISASLEGSPPKPSTAPRASVSLEGSEPTLGEADRPPPRRQPERPLQRRPGRRRPCSLALEPVGPSGPLELSPPGASRPPPQCPRRAGAACHTRF